jgi:hypothetical protein
MLTMSAGLLAFNYAYGKFNESGLFTDKGEGVPFVNTMNAIIDGMVIGPMRLVGLYAAFPAWIGAGVALVSIGAGISKFVEMVEKNVDVKSVGASVASVLGSVAGAIIEVYNTGIDWDNVEDGLDAFGEVGNVIMGLAEGVAKMATLQFPIYGEGGKISGYFGINDKQFEQVSANIKLLMTTVGDALAEIGRTQGETSWFSKSDAEKGKEIIQGIGGDLVGIVDFVQKAATLQFPIYDANGKQIGVQNLDPAMLEKGGQVYRNIVAMVRSVSDALAEIGSGAAAQSGWFSDSDIEKGKEAIRGVAGDIGGIAELVKSVATVQNFEDVEYRIRRTIALIPESIMAVAAFVQQNKAVLETTAQSITGLVWGPVNAITEVLGRVVEKGITDVTGRNLGSSIASIIGGFAGLNPDASAYNGLWSMTAFLDKLVESESPISKLATSLEKINKSFSGFAGTFKKMSADTVKNTDLLLKTMIDFSKIQPGAFNEVEVAARRFVDFVYERAAAAPLTPPSAQSYTQIFQQQSYTPAAQAPFAQAPQQGAQNQSQQAQKAAQDQLREKQMQDMQQNQLMMQQQMQQMNMKLQQLVDILGGTIKVRQL